MRHLAAFPLMPAVRVVLTLLAALGLILSGAPQAAAQEGKPNYTWPSVADLRTTTQLGFNPVYGGPFLQVTITNHGGKAVPGPVYSYVSFGGRMGTKPLPGGVPGSVSETKLYKISYILTLGGSGPLCTQHGMAQIIAPAGSQVDDNDITTILCPGA